MCGIVGFNSKNSAKIDAMLDSIKHRGPDGVGKFESDLFSMGHVRLSILDLSKNGDQPMYFENIVNGIIENYTKKGIFECCYYEVEAIFIDIADRMPIGNRILFFDKENFENSFHVFIPNFSEEYVLENSCYLKYRERYKSGFSKKELQFIGSNYNC